MIKTDYLRNHQVDDLWRGVAYTKPTSLYIGLFKATAGQSPRSTAVTSGQTTVPASVNGHMYRCTTAGTTGSGEPAWPTIPGGTVTDGTAVWTEMSPDFRANNGNLTEVSGSSYARVAVVSNTTNWASTGGATTTTNPSAGTSGVTSNNVAINFPTPSGAWGLCVFVGIFDASTAGNLLEFGGLTVALNVTSSSTPINFPISSLVVTDDV